VDAFQNIADRKTIFRWLLLAIISTGVVVLREYDDIGFTYRIEEVNTFAIASNYFKYNPQRSGHAAKPATTLSFQFKNKQFLLLKQFSLRLHNYFPAKNSIYPNFTVSLKSIHNQQFRCRSLSEENDSGFRI